MYEKVEVNGKNTHPVYQCLRLNAKELSAGKNKAKEIPWNFAKFLVNEQGQIHAYFPPKTSPMEIKPEIMNMF